MYALGKTLNRTVLSFFCYTVFVDGLVNGAGFHNQVFSPHC